MYTSAGVVYENQMKVGPQNVAKYDEWCVFIFRGS